MPDTNSHTTGPAPCRIPADISQPDRVLAGLTARQLAILAGVAALLIVGWNLSRPWLPTDAYLAVAGPIALAALALALLRHPDGTSLEAHLLAAADYWLRPRHLATHPRAYDDSPGAQAVPDWLTQRASTVTADSNLGTEQHPRPQHLDPAGGAAEATRATDRLLR